MSDTGVGRMGGWTERVPLFCFFFSGIKSLGFPPSSTAFFFLFRLLVGACRVTRELPNVALATWEGVDGKPFVSDTENCVRFRFTPVERSMALPTSCSSLLLSLSKIEYSSLSSFPLGFGLERGGGPGCGCVCWSSGCFGDGWKTKLNSGVLDDDDDDDDNDGADVGVDRGRRGDPGTGEGPAVVRLAEGAIDDGSLTCCRIKKSSLEGSSNTIAEGTERAFQLGKCSSSEYFWTISSRTFCILFLSGSDLH